MFSLKLATLKAAFSFGNHLILLTETSLTTFY